MLITKEDGIDELIKKGNQYNIEFEFNNSNVIVYHGTTTKISNEIISSKFFKDGFFYHNKESYNDFNYAKIRSIQSGSDDEGIIMTFQVDPRCLTVNGAGETESLGNLYLDNDNVWKTKEYLYSNTKTLELNNFEKFYNKLNNNLTNDMNISIGKLIYQSIRHYHYNEKLDIESSIKNLKSYLDDIISLEQDYYVNKNELIDINDNVDLEEWEDEMLDSGDYDDIEDLKDLEESFYDGFNFKECFITNGYNENNYKIFVDLLREIKNIVNPTHFYVSLNENRIKTFKEFSNLL